MMDKVMFGKYRGMNIEDVIDVDPGWLLWAEKTIKWFKLDEDQRNRCIYKTEFDFSKFDYFGLAKKP